MPLSPSETCVCQTIAARAAALLADLRLHVSIPTGSGHTPGLDQTRTIFCDRLRRLGAAVELIPGQPSPDWLHGVTPSSQVPPTAVCRRPTAAGREVLLAGHLDTVHDPAGPLRELTVAPDGKTATGPGCVDMKGGLVIAVAALEALDECGCRLPWTFLLNSDEETGSYHSEGAIRTESARIAKAGGVGLALEPAMADGGLVVERSGTSHFLIESRGKAAHVGRDFASGISAVTALAKCILDAAAMSDPVRGIIVNVSPLQGGIATNVVPDLARAWGNVRFKDSAQGEQLKQRLEALATPHGSESRATIAIKTSFVRAAKPLTDGTRRLADSARAAAEDLGQRLPFGSTAGVCDGNNMQAAGLPTIDTLGVRGGGLHTPQEWIEIPSLVERCQLLAVLMMRLV